MRLTFFKDWTRLIVSYVEDNKGPAPLPPTFNIGAFYYPKGLFSAILQSSARSIALPIDQLKFSYQVLDNDEESHLIQSSTAHDIVNGITIDGLYLDGAQWDSEQHQMVDCTDQQRTHRLPPLLCKLIPVGSSINRIR